MIDSIQFHFLLDQDLPQQLINPSYDIPMVVGSVLIAIFASYVAFVLAARIKRSQLKKESDIWTWLASCFLGVGIWAMHFVGMLAYQLPFVVDYNIEITVLSVVPAILASYIVLSPQLSRYRNLVIKSIMMGLGIGSMHYVGMMAMRIPAQMAYDPYIFAFSVIVAVTLSGFSLKLNDMRQTSSLGFVAINSLSAILMGLAISGMHYTGMAAMRVWGGPETGFVETQANHFIAELIVIAVVLLSIFLLIGLELRTRAIVAVRLNTVLEAVQEAVVSIDCSGHIEFVNTSTTAMFGYEPRELIGQNVKILMPDSYAKNHDQYVANSNHDTQNKVFGSSRLLKGKKKNGDIFPITLTIAALSNEKTGGFVGTIRDMSDLRSQEAFMQTVFDSVPMMIAVKDAKDLTFSHINNVGVELMGRPKEEIIGYSDQQLFDADTADFFESLDKKAIQDGKQIVIDEKPLVIGDESRYLRTKKTPIYDSSGKIKYVLGVSEDITDLVEAHKEIEHINQRISFATGAAKIGVWEWNMEDNTLIWDDVMFVIFGLSPTQFNGEYGDWAKLLYKDDYDIVVEALQECVANRKDFHQEFRINRPDGQIRYIKGDGRFYGNKMIGINYDVTERVLAEQKIRKMAESDALTGLANRTALVKFLKREKARSKRTGNSVVVLYLDLNKFKPINDTHGHKVGDEVLIEISKRMGDVAREVDCVARVGGDEFVVALADMPNLQALDNISERYHSAIAKPIKTEAGELVVGVSIGSAQYPKDGETIDDLLNVADERMFEEKKRSGAGR